VSVSAATTSSALPIWSLARRWRFGDHFRRRSAARYRHGRQREALLTPDIPERFAVNMMPVSIVIPKGARLRLTVTSSDYPAINRNLNTGQPLSKARKSQPAINMTYHDRLRPSHVVLPVLGKPGDGSRAS
jgi:predicted acyl esterase